MDSPSAHSSDLQGKTAGLGLAVGMVAPAAAPQPNEAGTVALVPAEAVEEGATPRLVIRGENHSTQPNPHAAFIDWLNFTFRFRLSGNEGLMEIDQQLRRAFGFGIGINRNKKHLNYEHSWDLGNRYGIFATGGDSVRGTSLISLSGEGCSVVTDWHAVHDFIALRQGRITRIDLAHDDYEGRISLISLQEWFKAGDFHSGRGHPPSGEFIDDFGSGKGKTLYVGQRANGKLLRIYEKGKQLGDPTSPWVRWEVELHNKDRIIPLDTLVRPAPYMAAAYPVTQWICDKQSRIETTKRTLNIELEVLTASARKSYGKLFWYYWKVLDLSPVEIVEKLAVEGIPSRLNHAVPGEV